MPQLSLTFGTKSAPFEFRLDQDEYFESFLWSMWLSTQRSIQYRISPPTSPKLLSIDRVVRQEQMVQEGWDRLRRVEFPEGCDGARVEERELTVNRGPAVWLKLRLFPVDSENEFRAAFEGLRVDAASVVVTHEDAAKNSDVTMFLLG
ncbi:TAFII28 domain containing protein [Ceratobasidium theobromae]|uniref:TAFII28 domain containing protein n=1 Tax=Ceratobasidium theobromae TaxID=1582974 RepID=A0A5N5QAE3_9AGAM|nr:TAFII28 domain containing protein [Ceratobasidium theobromae]